MPADAGEEEANPARQVNLQALERALREQWNLGQRILLCWRPTPRGLSLLAVPHHYLGHLARAEQGSDRADRLVLLNARFVSQLIAGPRQLSPEDFAGAARRLELTPVQVDLPQSLVGDPVALRAAEALVRRYSISHVPHRAVLLLDIVDFSLHPPLEQASQLNSLTCSLNAACSQLRNHQPDIELLRTTTGDGFYVWNRDHSPRGNLELFRFLLLVMADNALARRQAQHHKVPLLRVAYHIGSHYEFCHVDGLAPTLHHYIVGEVTIELARLLEQAGPGQILVGEFVTRLPTSGRESAFLLELDSQRFVERVNRGLLALQDIELSGQRVRGLHCFLSGEPGVSAGQALRRYRIVDKHGRSRHAYNLRVNIHTEGRPIILGMPSRPGSGHLHPNSRRRGGVFFGPD